VDQVCFFHGEVVVSIELHKYTGSQSSFGKKVKWKINLAELIRWINSIKNDLNPTQGGSKVRV
jgi:hypothetical protein